MKYNAHIEKYQKNSALLIRREALRNYENKDNYKNYVDHEKTKNNIYVQMNDDGFNWNKKINEAVDMTQNTTGRKIRSGFVATLSVVESCPSSWDDETSKKYLQEKCEWLKSYLIEKENISPAAFLSYSIHLDETTPHYHFAFMPIKENEQKLCANNIMTRKFLQSFQNDSQEFTMHWIDKWNSDNMDQPIEKLEPTTGEKRRHLNEQEYKEKKISENINQLELQQQNLTIQNDEIQNKLENTKKEIGDLHQEKQELIEAKSDFEEKSKVLQSMLDAPTSVPEYLDVVKENVSLKEELTVKDQIIAALKEQTEKLKETIESWKSKFQHFTEKIGSKLSRAAGIDEVSPNTNELPAKEVSIAIEEMTNTVKEISVKDLRVLPDQENKYKVSYRNNTGEYITIKNGFETREDAEKWRTSLKQNKEALKLDEAETKQMTNTL